MRAVSQVPVPGWGVKLPPPVDLRAHEQDTDTEIQPQHHQDHCRQASVGHSEIFKIPEVNGECGGKQGPAHGCEGSSRRLAFNGKPAERKDRINSQEKYK